MKNTKKNTKTTICPQCLSIVQWQELTTIGEALLCVMCRKEYEQEMDDLLAIKVSENKRRNLIKN